MEELIHILTAENCSLVLRATDGVVHKCYGRGVADLYRLLTEEPELLRGATVADKVVGRGAASLMILGEVAAFHTLLLSEKALGFLKKSDVKFTFDTLVPHIINRQGNGICPVESLTSQAQDPQEAFELITGFISQNSNKNT